MAVAFQLTPRALDDLSEIWAYIAEDNLVAADRVESAILSACHSLARNPMRDSKREEITKLPVRFWTITRYHNYIVVYRPDTKPLQIVTVLHGMREMKAILK